MLGTAFIRFCVLANFPKKIQMTRMHSSRMLTVRSLPYVGGGGRRGSLGVSLSKGASVRENPSSLWTPCEWILYSRGRV